MSYRKMRYTVDGYGHDRRGVSVMIIIEWTNGYPINRYSGYNRGGYIDLFPRKAIRNVGIPMRRKRISVQELS